MFRPLPPLIAILLLASTLPLARADPLKLRDVQLQELPANVDSVLVGPDDRPWLQLATTFNDQGGTKNDPAIKADLLAQFNEKAPQIHGARPILFGPGPRVWVTSEWGKTITSYDGKTVIEKSFDTEHRLTGTAVQSPGDWTQHWNLTVGACSFFAADHGVWCFDGTNWTYQDFKLGYLTTLLPTADGKGLIATSGEEPATQNAWRWRDGQWMQILSSALIDTGPKTPSQKQLELIPCADETILIIRNPPDTNQRPDPKDPPATLLAYRPSDPHPDISALVPQLADNQFTVRDTAAKKILSFGLSALVPVEEARHSATDLETIAQLATIAQSLVTPHPAALGQYTFKHFYFCVTSPQGDAYLGVQSVTDTAPGGKTLPTGILIRDHAGNVSLMSYPDDVRTFQSIDDRDATDGVPFFALGRIWIGTTWIDLNTRKIGGTIVVPQPAAVLAVQRDGTLFLSGDRSDAGVKDNIRVYRPAFKPDPNQPAPKPPHNFQSPPPPPKGLILPPPPNPTLGPDPFAPHVPDPFAAPAVPPTPPAPDSHQ